MRWMTFTRFWSAVPGVDQVRIKEDETNLMRPDAGHAAGEWNHPCHYLWRGPLYVKHNGDVYPCCQSYMLDGAPVGRIGERSAGGDLRRRRNAAHARTPRCRTGRRNRHLRALLHHHSASRASGGQPAAPRQNRAHAAAMDREIDLRCQAAKALAESPQARSRAAGGSGTGPDPAAAGEVSGPTGPRWR